MSDNLSLPASDSSPSPATLNLGSQEFQFHAEYHNLPTRESEALDDTDAEGHNWDTFDDDIHEVFDDEIDTPDLQLLPVILEVEADEPNNEMVEITCPAEDGVCTWKITTEELVAPPDLLKFHMMA